MESPRKVSGSWSFAAGALAGALAVAVPLASHGKADQKTSTPSPAPDGPAQAPATEVVPERAGEPIGADPAPPRRVLRRTVGGHGSDPRVTPVHSETELQLD